MFNRLLGFCLLMMVGLVNAHDLKLLLPEVIYAVPGVECNVYFDNIVLTPNPANYIFDVDCEKGRNDEKRWRFTPTEADLGTFEWKITIFDAEKAIAKGVTTVKVVPANTGENREISILVIGDSLTGASMYPTRIFTQMQKSGNPKFKMIGGNKTKTEGVVHEGFGGWTWNSFLTKVVENPDPAKPRNITSRFLVRQDGSYALDFQNYLNEHNEGQAPDLITVMLGINDIFSAQDDNLEERIKNILENAERLLAEFRRVAPNAVIGIGFPTPGAYSQDAFGSNYKCGQTRWQFKKNQHALCRAMLKKFSNSDDKKMILIPTFVNLDCENNFPTKTEPINDDNTQVIRRQSNGVHPASTGYNQIGDTFYCWIKAQL